MRPTLVLALFSLTIACATTDSAGEVQPVPMAETASAGANGSTHGLASHLAFAMSDPLTHEWTDERGRRIHAVLCVSYSFGAEQSHAATQQVHANWPHAAEQARELIAGSDLTTETGTVQCEEDLCAMLTRTLFPNSATEGSRVERVVWQRLTWN